MPPRWSRSAGAGPVRPGDRTASAEQLALDEVSEGHAVTAVEVFCRVITRWIARSDDSFPSRSPRSRRHVAFGDAIDDANTLRMPGDRRPCHEAFGGRRRFSTSFAWTRSDDSRWRVEDPSPPLATPPALTEPREKHSRSLQTIHPFPVAIMRPLQLRGGVRPSLASDRVGCATQNQRHAPKVSSGRGPRGAALRRMSRSGGPADSRGSTQARRRRLAGTAARSERRRRSLAVAARDRLEVLDC